MKNKILTFSLAVASLALAACTADTHQSLKNVNQSIGNAQRNVDNANAVLQTSPDVNKEALKNAGQAIILQNPTVQEAQETIRASKELMNSVKALKQRPQPAPAP